MNTKINLTYKGVAYTLEYNRMIVKQLENAGFNIDEFMTKPMINIELVFAGAFIKNHSKLPQTIIDEIFSKCKDKTSLIQQLQLMIRETYDSLLDEPDDDEGNAMWEVVNLSPKMSQK